jgi:hypothetical protein
MLPREFFGVSEVEQLESPQRIFNKLINASLEILALMGNPIWVVSTDSGVNAHKLVNRTGLVVEKEPGSEVRREEGVQLSPTVLSLVDRLESWFNGVAGTQDVSRGEAPASVTASSAIEQLMDASRTRIKQKQRNLDATVRDLGQHYADIVLANYSKSRVYRVTNDQTGTRYFKMRIENREMPDGSTRKVAITREFVEHPEAGLMMAPEDKEHFISGRFDVRVNTGTSLPFAIADKEQKAYALFDRGIIDAEEVLNQIDYPNKEVILQRLNEKAAQAAQAQAPKGA